MQLYCFYFLDIWLNVNCWEELGYLQTQYFIFILMKTRAAAGLVCETSDLIERLGVGYGFEPFLCHSVPLSKTLPTQYQESGGYDMTDNIVGRDI